MKTPVRRHIRKVRGGVTTVRHHVRSIHPRRITTTVEPFRAGKYVGEADVKTSIVVPSTKNKTEPITRKEYEERVDEIHAWYARHFGGYSSIDERGGYVIQEGPNKGRIAKEKVDEVIGYTNKDDWAKNREAFKRLVHEERRKWGQESVTATFQDKAFFVGGKE
jgi:hypothetical protein